MPQIFISYRRDDSQAETERIHDRLVQAFGSPSVFLDVDNGIPSGSDFAEVLENTINKSDVMLVIIGTHWLDAKEKDNPDLRRLDNPEDFVRKEVEAALKRESMLVIPVLIRGAAPPTEKLLPESLRDLAGRQMEHVRQNPDFHRDMDHLIEFLRTLDKRKRPILRPQQSSRSTLTLAAAAVAVLVVVVAMIIFVTSNNGTGSTTPTDTPAPGTAVVLLLTQRAGETLTSVAPTMTHTPDLTQTIDALVTQYFITATAEAAQTNVLVNSTSVLLIPSSTPSPTEDQNATATANQASNDVAATQTADVLNNRATLDAQATANKPTNTPPPPPTNTPTETPTPTNTPTMTATSTPRPNLTQTAVSIATQAVLAAQAAVKTQQAAAQNSFTLRDRQVIFTSNFANKAGCAWQGIGGQVFGPNGDTIKGIKIHVTGDKVDEFVNSGSSTAYGPGGWEVAVDTRVSNHTYYVQVVTPNDDPVSERITVNFPLDCQRNLALVNFQQGG